MRFARSSLIIAAAAFLVAISTGVAVAERLGLNGQAITGHEIVAEWKHASKVCFTTARSVPGDDFCVVVSNEILKGEVRTASIYWHGDGVRTRFEIADPFSRRGIFAHARRVVAEGPVIAVIRPHSSSKYDWRQMSEIRLHIALVEYINRAFEVKKFNLYGHSGGGLVAIAVAQERSELTASVGLASPKLAVREHYIRHENGVPNRYHSQYDPIDHIHKLSPDIPVLVIYDDLDWVVKKGGVFPYIRKAEELKKKVRLIFVRTNYPNHFTQWLLGDYLRRPENREFSTRK